MASYSASKFALEGATESLWYEMRPWNIHVSLIQPGFVRSDGFAHVLFNPDTADRARHNPDDPYHRYYTAMAPFILAADGAGCGHAGPRRPSDPADDDPSTAATARGGDARRAPLRGPAACVASLAVSSARSTTLCLTFATGGPSFHRGHDTGPSQALDTETVH